MADIRCVKCGKIVLQNIPEIDKRQMNAWVECHVCVNDEVFSDRVIFDQITLYNITQHFFELFMKAKFKGVDMNRLKENMNSRFNKAMNSKMTKEGYYRVVKDESDKIKLLEGYVKEVS